VRGSAGTYSDGSGTSIRRPRGTTVRLLICGAVALAIAAYFAGVRVGAGDRGAATRQALDPAVSTESSPQQEPTESPPTSTPSDSTPTELTPTEPPAKLAVPLVSGFSRGWLLRGGPAAREKALRGYVTAELLRGLLRTDTRLLPPAGTKLSGRPKLEEATPSTGTYRQRLTDGESILVDIAYLGGDDWRVVGVKPGKDEIRG
jgi:hypothetical protein